MMLILQWKHSPSLECKNRSFYFSVYLKKMNELMPKAFALLYHYILPTSNLYFFQLVSFYLFYLNFRINSLLLFCHSLIHSASSM